MSKKRIQQYYKDLKTATEASNSDKEGSIRRHFANLLQFYAEKNGMMLGEEVAIKVREGNATKTKFPDGAIKYAHKVSGFWEAKDSNDDLEAEIINKFNIGYPQFNILFEDSETAILYQAQERNAKGAEVMRADMKDYRQLDKIIREFIGYELPEVRNFREALEQFKEKVPKISRILKTVIEIAGAVRPFSKLNSEEQTLIQPIITAPNMDFIAKRDKFLRLCKQAVNPHFTVADVREMLVQHILTENIFTVIFGDSQFHQENNIASELREVANAFFNKNVRRNTTDELEKQYQVIEKEAKEIDSHDEKQKFLKLIYEEFYKAYDQKKADRLGVVYTPNEIVRFMIQSTDSILSQHFEDENGDELTLQDRNVEILDPATGTGTFITDLLDYFKGMNDEDFDYKYDNEIHCNEVAVLPYYIANLNIEYTYKAIRNQYRGFENIVFADTLDNIQGMASGHLGKNVTDFYGETGELNFGGVSQENMRRLTAQNQRKISVIIGNPPYNANQMNENDNNKNREYQAIDKRIKATYIKESNAQKTKVYDMYSRFYRWASDRMHENGIVAFITNRSFIDSRTFDGFRKSIQSEFDFAYIVDTASDVRANPKIAGTTHNVFGIQTGVAVLFLVKKKSDKPKKCKIYYSLLADSYEETDLILKGNKLDWFAGTKFENVGFERITPDKNGNWINLTDNDFETLMPIISKDKNEETIFGFSSLGVSTNRDEWVYDFDKKTLQNKTKFFIESFLAEKNRWIQSDKKTQISDFLERRIKFSASLEQHLLRFAKWEEELNYLQNLPPNGKRVRIKTLKEKLTPYLKFKFSRNKITQANYRPFIKMYYYSDSFLSDRLTQNHYDIFGDNLKNNENKLIGFVAGTRLNFDVYATNLLPNLATFSLDPARWIPLYRYESGKKVENITDWALGEFRKYYGVDTHGGAYVQGNGNADKNNILVDTHGGAYVQGNGNADENNVSVDTHGGAYVQGNQNADKNGKSEIQKMDIFHYVYGVLHNPKYRTKYEQNLKRDFPRIPFYSDFWKWANWGKKLMDLHLNYETVDTHRTEIVNTHRRAYLQRHDTPLKNPKAVPKAKLRRDKKTDEIILDEITVLSEIPLEAWEYKLGNRSALEWVLDQYKEKKPRDKTIAEKFNTYQFADYKEDVIKLLQQVCTVSVETMRIIREMEKE